MYDSSPINLAQDLKEYLLGFENRFECKLPRRLIEIRDTELRHYHLLSRMVELSRLVKVKLDHFSGMDSGFENCQFLFAEIVSANFSHFTFKNCYFNQVMFENCSFRHTSFDSCIFENCQFTFSQEVSKEDALSVRESLFTNCDFSKDELVRSLGAELVGCLFLTSSLPKHLIAQNQAVTQPERKAAATPSLVKASAGAPLARPVAVEPAPQAPKPPVAGEPSAKPTENGALGRFAKLEL